jgi:hypothetical protein
MRVRSRQDHPLVNITESLGSEHGPGIAGRDDLEDIRIAMQGNGGRVLGQVIQGRRQEQPILEPFHRREPARHLPARPTPKGCSGGSYSDAAEDVSMTFPCPLLAWQGC